MPFRLVLYNEDQVHVIKFKKNKIALRTQSKFKGQETSV